MNPQSSDLYNIVTIQNIDNEDFIFTVNKEPYLIKAGETRNFPKFMVNIGLKHLIDKILLKRDPEGKLQRRLDLRDELASQIIIEEVSYQKPQTPTDEEIVQQVNRPSDLDRLLQKNKETLKKDDTVIPLPVIPQPEPNLERIRPTAEDIGGSGQDGDLTVNEQSQETFQQLEEEKQVQPMPTKKQMINYAVNTLKLTMDDKTKKAWDKMKNEELFTALGLDKEEDLEGTGIYAS